MPPAAPASAAGLVMPPAVVAPAVVPPLSRGPIPPRAPVKRIDAARGAADLWQRIRDGFAMPELDNAYVRRHVSYYTRRPDYLQRMFERSRPYLYHIVEEIERRGLPTELALLPMVESAFNPMAHSPARASGLWQFIPGTGRRFGLEQDWWYDERRDVVDSTSAALDYLTELHHMYRDWHLALASYNWGENAVARAIAKNRRARKSTGYWHLRMPRETRNYVPKLQALKNIIRSPARHGLELKPIPNERYFVTLADTPAMDLHLAARLAEMPVEEFIALNPGFSRPLIRASVTPRIVLPADKVDTFHENLQKLDEKSLVSWTTYTPKKGETLESIAKKYGMTVNHLKEVNGIPARSRNLPSLMVVPAARNAAMAMTRLPIMYAPPIPITYRRIYHTVKPGETLASIAKRYGVALDDVKRLNPKGAVVGQKVTMEVRASAKAKPKGKPKKQPKGKPRKNAG